MNMEVGAAALPKPCHRWLSSVEGKDRVSSLLQGGLVPRKSIEFTRGKYLVKTLNSLEELIGVFKLRFDIFHQTLQSEGQRTTGYDIDPYDSIADHLIVKDLESEKVVGTYRLILENLGRGFYSETEFNLGTLLIDRANPLEVSRACVESGSRQGVVLALLWQGLTQYAAEVGSDFLFGCSSVWTNDDDEAASVLSYLYRQAKVDFSYGVSPYTGLTFDERSLRTSQRIEADIEPKNLSPLLRVYLKAGAKVYGNPAYDEAFGCFDFLTGLNLSQVTEKYREKFIAK